MPLNDRWFKVFAVGVVVALIVVALVNLFQAERAATPVKAVSYSEFLSDVEHAQVRSVIISGQSIRGTLTDHSLILTYAPADPDLIKSLRQNAVVISVSEAPNGTSWVGVLSSVLPMLLLVGVAIFFMRRTPGFGGRSVGVGKTKARLLNSAQAGVTFKDVAGVDEATERLQEIVDFLRNPQRFERLGGRIPHGVLLVGPPGTGKTLLARAIAGEANVPFFTISGSDFVEMFVGVGASRVRDLFDQAKKSAPCIIFMDEIDAVGRRRGAGLSGTNDEREQTLNQLLVEMDGFQRNEGVILIAATNRPDVLDPALLRPGRFDREIVVSNPDVVGRVHILQVHTRKVPLAPDVDLNDIARVTPGFSGADLMNLVNEAALLAARRAKSDVGMQEFEDAKDTVTMGDERRTHVMTDEEKRLTAYREGGRAIVALNVASADPVHKATIITRGRSSGMVKQLPDNDQRSLSVEQMTARIAIMLSGRAAEEMIFGRHKVTSAAARDIQDATQLAQMMVTRWGLSEALGAVAFGENGEDMFHCEQTAQTIAVEVRKIIDAGLATARQILVEHRADLETLSAGLLQYETLSGEEIRVLLSEGRRGAGLIEKQQPPGIAET
jgi:cell division protease FtsH